jgi:hypothetical protein
MEPQDNNPQFTGISQSETSAFTQSKSGKIWKTMSTVFIVLFIGAAAGLVFFFLKSQDDTKKIDDLEASISSKTAELNRFKEAAGVDNPDDATTGTGKTIEFSAFFNAMAKFKTAYAGLALDKDSFIKPSTDGKYQIAKLDGGSGGEDGGGLAFFFRALPDGEWTFSNFSGNGQPLCDDVTEAEIAAFDGVVECYEAGQH